MPGDPAAARHASYRRLNPAPAVASFASLPSLMRIYLVVLVTVGGAILAHGLTHVPLDRLPLFLTLLVLSSAAAAVKVALPLTAGGSTLSLSYVFNFVALVSLGPSAAVPIAVASAWTQCTFKQRLRNPPYRTVFSMAALALTVESAGWVYIWVMRPLPDTLVAQTGAAGVAATLYFLLNTLLVAAAVALSSGGRFADIWRGNFLWSSPTYYAGAFIAVLAVAAARAGGPAWAVVLAIPAYVSYRSYRAYSERVAAEQRQVRLAADLQLRVIEALALAIEAKDRTSRQQFQLMQSYSEGLARALGLSEDDVRGVRTAALLHNIGNLAVPEHILAKPGPLSDAEFERVKTHPRVGAEILESVPFPYAVAPLILAHHERWDGRGYPDQLKGEGIPLGARVLSVVDCFAAMRSDRPFRPARTHAEAIATLRENSGSALDPSVVEAFVEVLPDLEAQLRATLGGPAPAATAGTAAAPAVVDSALDHIAVAHLEEQVVRDMAEALTATRRVSDVLALISTRLLGMLPFSASALFLFDDASQLYLCRHATGAHHESIRAVTSATIDGIGEALPGPTAGGEPGGPARFESVLLAPLQLDGRTVGALAFYHTARGAFGADHHRFVLRVASQAAPVVANALAFERAQEQSLTDLLTGLPNRRHVERQLAQELSRAQRRRGHVSVILLDLDRFKHINDMFGHDAGDQALVAVAQSLRAGLRDYDVCARLAGDEFVVVLADCNEEQAHCKRLALQRAVAGVVFRPAADRVAPLSISAGIATFPADGESPAALLAAADRRMYRDKSARAAGNHGTGNPLRS